MEVIFAETTLFFLLLMFKLGYIGVLLGFAESNLGYSFGCFARYVRSACHIGDKTGKH